MRVMLRHVLPNVLSAIIVYASFEVARMIIMEAALSFLGLGVEPAIPSWGAMLSDGRSYLQVAWWPATLPGLAIMLTVLSVNLVGDWMRDELDPRAAVLHPV
jgi:peptide/nickel transport system permease protein